MKPSEPTTPALGAIGDSIDRSKKVIAVLESAGREHEPELGQLLASQAGHRQVVSLHRNAISVVAQHEPGHHSLRSTDDIIAALGQIRPDVVVIEKFFLTPRRERETIDAIRQASPTSKIALQRHTDATEHLIPHADRIAAVRDGYLLLPADDHEAARMVLGAFGRVKAPESTAQRG